MTDEEIRARVRQVAEIVEEFARARGIDGRERWEARVRVLSPRYLKWLDVSREELLAQGPSGDELLHWRDGDIDKDVQVARRESGRVEVRAQAGEVAGPEGLPVPEGAWCRWPVGEVAEEGADLRERLIPVLEEAVQRLQSLSLEDLRREHQAMREHVEQHIDPLLEEVAAAREGQVVKGEFQDLYAKRYGRFLGYGRWTERAVEWPREYPRFRLEVGVYPLSQTASVQGRAKCDRWWLFRLWTQWGPASYWGERAEPWTDLEQLRELVARVARLLDLMEELDEFVWEHSLGMHVYHSDQSLSQSVVLTRRGFLATWRIGVELKREGLTVKAGVMRRKTYPRRTLGTVTPDDPDLCEKAMALVEQAWEIVKPGGTKDFEE